MKNKEVTWLSPDNFNEEAAKLKATQEERIAEQDAAIEKILTASAKKEGQALEVIKTLMERIAKLQDALEAYATVYPQPNVASEALREDKKYNL